MNKILACSITLILILGSTSGLLLLQNEQLKKEVNSLKVERDELTLRVKALIDENEKLNAQVEKLTMEKENLTSKVEALTLEKSRLEEVIEEQKDEISSLNKRINELNAQVNSLNLKISSLTSQIVSLKSERDELKNKIDTLSNEIAELKNENSRLTSQLNQALDKLNKVEVNYNKWREYLLSYSTLLLNYTVKRVFSDSELEALKDVLLREVLRNPGDPWRSFQDIYNWITSKIKYVSDEPFPIPPSFNDFICDNVTNTVICDMMMSPSQTISLRQGDCDDQAALAYAMIRSYEEKILRQEYALWLMYVELEGVGHVAVALPSTSNNRTLLTIVDPAGHYLTKNVWGEITAKDPLTELKNYRDYWARAGYWIKTITLYEVSNGVAYELVRGSIHQVADFISRC